MDRSRAVKMDPGTAFFSKAKEYRKMKIGASDSKEDQQEHYAEESSGEENRNASRELSEE